MRFQRNSVIVVTLLSSSCVTLPADTKTYLKSIREMSIPEIGKLDLGKLSLDQKMQLFYVALFSGLEHKQLAARKVINKLQKFNISDWKSLKQKVIDAGLDKEVLTNLKDPKKREEIKQHYKDGWFSGLEHKKQKAQKYLKSKGYAVSNKLRQKVIDAGLLSVVFQEEDDGKELTKDIPKEETKEKAKTIALPELEEAKEAEEGQITLKVPDGIAAATGMPEVTLSLDDDETFTLETFGDLIDQKEGSLEIVTTFSQGPDGNWYVHHYDAESYRTPREGAEGDPVTGLPVRHEYASTISRTG